MFQKWIFDTYSSIIIEITYDEGLCGGRTYEYTCDEKICYIAETASDNRVYMIYMESIDAPEQIRDEVAKPGKTEKSKWLRRR